jgi:hypothetical protein
MMIGVSKIKCCVMLGLVVLGGCASSRPITAQGTNAVKSEKPMLVTLGLTNELKQTEWRDARLGFGLQVLLSQLFYDSGKFLLLEEKDELKEKRRKLTELMWLTENPSQDLEASEAQFGKGGATHIVYGRIFYFGKPKTNLSFGGARMNRQNYVVRLELTLKNLVTGKKISAEGEGEAATTATSILFQFRENGVEFEKTTVGNAVRDALQKAFDELLKKN